MSTYAVNKLCRDALHDPAFRDALKCDPKSAMASLSLTDEERSALLSGDVAWLYERGGSVWSPWLSHLLVDAAIFVIGWDLLQRSAP